MNMELDEFQYWIEAYNLVKQRENESENIEGN